MAYIIVHPQKGIFLRCEMVSAAMQQEGEVELNGEKKKAFSLTIVPDVGKQLFWSHYVTEYHEKMENAPAFFITEAAEELIEKEIDPILQKEGDDSEIQLVEIETKEDNLATEEECIQAGFRAWRLKL